MVDRFFLETLGVTYDFLIQTIKQYASEDLISFSQMERLLFNKARSIVIYRSMISVNLSP